MTSFVFMKILESAPSRYDAGIRLLTGGRLDQTYNRLVSRVLGGQRVIDLGCGTGALTLRAARKGARVKGIDVNPQMLEIAHRRAGEAGLTRNIQLAEMGVAELGEEQSESYDVAMSGLCFSELTEDELSYTLKEVERILSPGGILLVADEISPTSLHRRIVNRILRLPLVVITYLMTQTTTHAVRDLPVKVKQAGLSIESLRLSGMQSFAELAAKKPGRTESPDVV